MTFNELKTILLTRRQNRKRRRDDGIDGPFDHQVGLSLNSEQFHMINDLGEVLGVSKAFILRYVIDQWIASLEFDTAGMQHMSPLCDRDELPPSDENAFMDLVFPDWRELS